MTEVILDATFDSLTVFVFVFIVYIVLSFFELKAVNVLKKGKKYNALWGSLFGLVPQCGVSVIASDLYLKRHISMGTLVSIFLVCSDEALVLLLGSGSNAIVAIPLVISKLLIGFIVGFIVDIFVVDKKVDEHIQDCDECDISGVKCCCNHCMEEEEITKFDIHVWHPFIHSIKLLATIFSFNVVFGMMVYFVGEENIINFLEFNKYFTPLFATLVGLIPNCASSIILTELFISGAIGFGALLSGLLVNAGIGLLIIFKQKSRIKDNLRIVFILCTTAILSGYLTCLIIGF